MQDATRIDRRLATLADLTGVDLLLQLWPVALRIARLVHQFRQSPRSPEDMFHFETELQQLLFEAGRRIVQWTVNHLEPESPTQLPALLVRDGEYYRRRYKTPMRNLNCLFGRIQLRRFCYQLTESTGRCLFPLEWQLGIVSGVATPALADRAARLSADLTQRQVLEQLRHQGIQWAVSTLRKLTETMASRMEDHRHDGQVEQLLHWLKQAAEQRGPRRFTLSVGRDGVMLPIVKCKKYREAATATISVMNGWGLRVGTVYLGQMPEAGQELLSDQLTQLITDVLRRWEGALPRLTYVTDCGHHQTEYFEQVLSRMRHPREPSIVLHWERIVDYYHACQYITTLAEAIFGPGREALTWAAKQRHVLKTKPNGCFRVLRSAGALRQIRGLIGSEDAYRGAYQYLRSRANRMDYRQYRRLRFPIGSGVTEAACKIVFTQRFKQSGMKWTIDGGSHILTLRVIALSGIWNNVRQATLRTIQSTGPVTPARNMQCSHEKQLKTAA